jgi:pimeloyl-ACP methyl ester carboxylesterase
MSASPLVAQEQPLSFFTEISSSPALEAYVDTLRGALSEAGFVLGEGAELPRVGRGEVFDIVAAREATIGFAFLRDRVGEGDGGAALLTVPAAFSTFESSRRAQQGFVGDRARSEITEDGALAVGLWTHGMDALLTQSSFTEIGDLEGLRIRANDPASRSFFARLGASPVAMPFAEVANALQVGAFDTTLWPQDGIEGDILSVIAGGTVLTDHSSRIAVTVVGDAWWTALGASEQRRFLAALERAEEEAAAVIAARSEELGGTLEEFGIVRISWADFSGEALDAAVVSTVEEISLLDSGAVQGFYDDVRTILQDIGFGPDGGSDLARPAGPARVFFATDRRYDPDAALLRDKFGNDDGETGMWHCGELVPSGPAAVGEFAGEIALVDGGTITSAEACITEIAEAAAESGGRVLIYVHGYRNDFRDATETGIAFAKDLALETPLIVWSWPSVGGLRNYPRDADAVDWSELQFGRFTGALAARPEIIGIDIMAHSMGTRLAANLMRDDWPGGEAAVVLAAADIARPNLRQAADATDDARISLFVSKKDVALFASQFLGAREPRAGRASPLFVHPGIDTVDLGAFDRIAVNHGPAFTVEEVVDDLARLFAGEWRATGRGLEARRNGGNSINHYLILPD